VHHTNLKQNLQLLKILQTPSSQIEGPWLLLLLLG